VEQLRIERAISDGKYNALTVAPPATRVCLQPVECGLVAIGKKVKFTWVMQIRAQM